MPELPEVERARRLIERVGVGRRIEKVRCDDDRIVFAGVAPSRVARVLTGQRLRAVRRRGKQLWWELDRTPWPLFHLGMTGQFMTPDIGPLPLASGPRTSDGWPPRYTKIHLRFTGGRELVMTNARRLGRIRLQDDPEREAPIAKLGFDPLYELPGRAGFAALLSRRSGVIKSVLLDQGLCAGIGNWLADEILYQAGIDPRRRVGSLDPAELERVRTRMKRIVVLACDVEADKSRFPRTWLFHHRWGKNEAAVTSRGDAIRHVTIGGRTTAYVPAVQR